MDIMKDYGVMMGYCPNGECGMEIPQMGMPQIGMPNMGMSSIDPHMQNPMMYMEYMYMYYKYMCKYLEYMEKCNELKRNSE